MHSLGIFGGVYHGYQCMKAKICMIRINWHRNILPGIDSGLVVDELESSLWDRVGDLAGKSSDPGYRSPLGPIRRVASPWLVCLVRICTGFAGGVPAYWKLKISHVESSKPM